MRVLLTNWRLEGRAGSELYLLDVARWLRDHGHVPVAYAPRLGSFADEIRLEAIAVVDDLRLIAEPPDVIHGQHHLATMTAIARFPGVPVVAFCHGWVPWEEMPVRHPSIRRYVAISAHTRERIVLESGIDPALVSVLPNFVDLERFRARTDLPDRPRRALLFSNYAVRGLDWVETIASACAALDISLVIVGLGYGNSIEHPEEYLHEFDLVFAKARASIEAMATGAAVILCDAAGLGPLVTPDNFEELRAGNFGMRVLRSAHEKSVIQAAIQEYDRDRVRAVADIVRSSLGLTNIVPRIAQLYEEAIAESKSAPADEREANEAVAVYLYQLNKLNPMPSEETRRIYETQLNTAYRALDRAGHDQQTIAAMEAKAAALEAELAAALDRAGQDRQTIAAMEAKAAALEAELAAAVDRAGQDQQTIAAMAAKAAALEAELEAARDRARQDELTVAALEAFAALLDAALVQMRI
jgi:predicted  nucleic acid-binding Zn-ribbon protein